jgi:hypothetical protein
MSRSLRTLEKRGWVVIYRTAGGKAESLYLTSEGRLAHITVVLPQVSCCRSGGVIQHPLSEEAQLHSAIPAPLDQLEAINLAFDRPG